jgi:hypothetical protein
MRATSSRIWFPITNIQPVTNIQPTHPSNHLNQPTDDRVADNELPNDQLDEQEHAATGSPVPTNAFPSRTGFGSDLVTGFAQLITDRISDGWSCQLVTIMFNQLPGKRASIMNQMKDEVQRVYSTLVTRVHRKPRTAPADELPILIGALDLHAYKRDRSSVPNVSCNGGLHVHALVLVPPTSRLGGSLEEHLRAREDLYAGPRKSVQRIHVVPVDRENERVVDYALKAILNGRLTYDEAMIVLPRTKGELTERDQSTATASADIRRRSDTPVRSFSQRVHPDAVRPG